MLLLENSLIVRHNQNIKEKFSRDVQKQKLHLMNLSIVKKLNNSYDENSSYYYFQIILLPPPLNASLLLSAT